jgi:5'(3')-deoxyribonucleotidase
VRILIDCDGVVADFVGGLIAAANPILTSPPYRLPKLTEDMFTAYEFKDSGLPPATVRVLNSIMNGPGFVEELPLYIGAVKAVDLLLNEGHEIVFVTKPHKGSPTWVYERTRWLGWHFPGQCKIVHTAHKELIPGDALIEDSPDNLTRWYSETEYNKPAHPVPILIDRPWNRGIKVGTRCVDMVHAASTLLGTY